MNLKSTPVPNFALWRMGQLSSSGSRVFMVLAHLSWSFSAMRFENLPASVFRDLVKLDHGGVRRGQAECVKAKLIRVERDPRRNAIATYTMLMPDGRPVEPLEGTTGVYRFDPTKWAAFLERRRSGSEQNAQGGYEQNDERSVQNAHTSEQNAHTPLSQNIQNAELSRSQLHDKNSDEVKTLMTSTYPLPSAENPSNARQSGPAGKSDVCISPAWDDVGQEKRAAKKRTREELQQHVEADPVVKRLQENFGARVVGIVDRKTGARIGNVGDPGVPYRQWVDQQVWKQRAK